MGNRKKKRQEDEGVLSVLLQVKDDTKRWILALFLFAIALFLSLAAFGGAGVAGTHTYEWLTLLFGAGYFLFPVILLLLSIAIVRPSESEEERRLLTPSLFGAVVLFLAGLGLVATLLEKGGLVGEYLAAPLLSTIDIFATVIVLTTVALAALIFTLDASPSFSWIRALITAVRSQIGGSAQEKDETDVDIAGTNSEDEDENDDGEDDEKTEDTEEEERADKEVQAKKHGGIFGRKNKAPREENDEHPQFNPAETLSYEYSLPPLSLLSSDKGKPGVGDIKANANVIKRTLQNFGINVEMDEISIGPSVTRYALKPAQGVKLSRIVGLKSDLSLALAAHPIRIEAPIPGRSLVGIEIPNDKRTTVGLASLLSKKEYQESDTPLLIAIGRGITGKPVYANLAKMPHLLVAGATGSGKSVSIHDIILSLIYRNSPEMLRFIMVDPKRVELTLYNKIPHLLTPVITDPKKTILALKWVTKEMERRYDILEAEAVRDIASYHQNVVAPAYAKASEKEDADPGELSLPERMPYIVIIIDELADIMSSYPRELEAAVVRLAQMSRAVGIHLILSTQRPSVNVITGLIKANIPVRMAFQVASQTDSRTIIDSGGAETLLGAGDMLYVSGEMSKPMRLQSAFVSEAEIKKIVQHIARATDNPGQTLMLTGQDSNGTSTIFESLNGGGTDDEEEDDLYEDARTTVIETGRASTTFLQRKLRVGYARAARLIDMLEEHGVVGPAHGSRQREILVSRDFEDEESGESDTEYSGGDKPQPNDDFKEYE